MIWKYELYPTGKGLLHYLIIWKNVNAVFIFENCKHSLVKSKYTTSGETDMLCFVRFLHFHIGHLHKPDFY